MVVGQTSSTCQVASNSFVKVDNKRKPFKVVICDLDGTLLNKEKRISRKHHRVVNMIRENNIPFIIATARSSVRAARYYEALGLCEPMICYNGAQIISSENKCLYDKTIAKKRLLSLIGDIYTFKPDTPMIAEIGTSFWTNTVSDIEKGELLKRKGCDNPLVSVMPESMSGTIFKLLVKLPIFTYEAVAREYEDIKAIPVGSVGLFESWIEIIHRQAGKAQAAEWICSYYGLTMGDVLSFGDAQQDQELLSLAGVGVAMGNSCEETKCFADYITESNEEDGIYKFLCDYQNYVG